MPTTDQNAPRKYAPVEWPLRFSKHSLGVASYDTYGLKLLYNNRYITNQDESKLQASSASIGPDYLDHLKGSYILLQNFLSTATLTWKSKDGTPLKATIDLGERFKDRLILHKVAREDIPDGASITNPDILFEVNDRTIRVYMRAYIPVNEPTIPGNKYSYHRDDLVLAFSRTY